MENQNNILIDIEDLLTFMVAGNFTFTVKSLRTQEHYSYNVKEDDEYEGLWNVRSYPKKEEVGSLTFDDGVINFNCKDKCNTTLAQVFVVVFNLMKLNRKHPQMELYRSNRCARCNRVLIDPSSITKGIGPECEQQNRELIESLLKK